ncbi:MAG: hypothetical protein HYU36_13900 [Planctomycetes bacterium]|nr:hypothetical protein [Planctomycetota bacterium]
MTPYHCQYWAHLLTLKRAGGSIENLTRSISNARLDLNPHQVDAALFALRSPLSRGVILADEVGLGKTIEAGIVLAQRWAERKRRILLIVPATLRKQWQQELDQKFYLPSTILESRLFKRMQEEGQDNPFIQNDRIVICSYHFDEEVTARLRVHRDKTLESLSERERWLLGLTRSELNGEAVFEPDEPRFRYTGRPAPACAGTADRWWGTYHFDWRKAEKNGDIFYRQEHALATSTIQRALSRSLAPAVLHLDYAEYGSVVAPLIGKSGWIELSKLTIESLDVEEFLVLVGCLEENGQALDEEVCRKLLLLPAKVAGDARSVPPDFKELRERSVETRVRDVEQRNIQFFDEEVFKLDNWSDDLKQGLEREIKELDKLIREARRAAALAASLAEKLEAQKTIQSLESTRKERRKRLFDAQDDIDSRRDDLIAKVEAQLSQKRAVEPLFTVRWTMISNRKGTKAQES